MARPTSALVAGLYVAFAARAAQRGAPDAGELPALVKAVESMAALGLAAGAHLAGSALEEEGLGCYRRLLYAAAAFGCLVALLLLVGDHLAGTAAEIAALAAYVSTLGIAMLSTALALALCLL